MGRVPLSLVLCLILSSIAVGASPTDIRTVPDRASAPAGDLSYAGRVGGETIETATEIVFLEFLDTGNTCGFLDDYDEVCPYPGSTAPDVVYSYTPNQTEWVDIDLCASDLDTKVYVYEGEYTPGAPYACVDDALLCGMSGWQSRIVGLEMTALETYYIVVDGYGESCGDYELYMHGWVPCVSCPPGALVEDEPECIDPTDDVWNGGCNVNPPAFQEIPPGGGTVYICGTSGTYNLGGPSYRDTDWYQIELDVETTITFECLAMFNVLIGILDGRSGCPVAAFYSSASAPVCYTATGTETLPAGTWWLWVGPQEFEGVACGAAYLATIEGYTGTLVDDDTVSWSTIKGFYR